MSAVPTTALAIRERRNMGQCRRAHLKHFVMLVAASVDRNV
ncbi:MAG: hypothetical protein OXE87_10770 [Chloroflexi bacterium]|nr:hypothetical protein [Chloroflexota bacterium]